MHALVFILRYIHAHNIATLPQISKEKRIDTLIYSTTPTTKLPHKTHEVRVRDNIVHEIWIVRIVHFFSHHSQYAFVKPLLIFIVNKPEILVD